MEKEKEKIIRALKIYPNGTGNIVSIENSLSELQSFVGGFIKIVRFGDIICIINEEGNFLDLERNFAFQVSENFYDIIVGNVIFVGDDGQNFRSLTVKELQRAVEIVTDGKAILEKIESSERMEE